MRLRKSWWAVLLALVVVVGGGLLAWRLLGNDKSATAGPVEPPAPKASANPSPDGIPFASPRASAVSTVSAPDAWGGPRKGDEATLSDRVVHYRITATLDPKAHTVAGQEQLRWRNRSDRPVQALYLHLYLNAFEGWNSTFLDEMHTRSANFRSDVHLDDGQWGHITLNAVSAGGQSLHWEFVHPDDGPPGDHTVVRVDLPEAVAPGAETTLDIGFDDQLPRVVARTGYFGTFHLVGQWFPKIGVLELPGERGASTVQWNVHEFHLHSEFYADYGDFDVRLRVPQGYQVGATGEQLDATTTLEGGLQEFHFVQGDVHDFAWTADRRSAPPLDGIYHGVDGRTVKVRVLYPPEYAASARPVLKATLDSLDWFSRTLGPYPYNTVTAVVPPYNAGEAGGMEYPTFFTADGFDEVEPGTIAEGALDFVTIHEFGHGYFYGILGSNEFEEPMLDEGLNQYWDMRMLRARNQPFHIATPFSKRLGLGLEVSGFGTDRLGAENRDPSDPIGANSWDRLDDAGFGSVYSRTSITMRDLEEAVGHERLEAAFKTYYQRWKFRHPSAADLRETLAEVTGQRELVERVFDHEVYHAQPVDDRIVTLESEEDTPQPGARLVAGHWTETTQAQADAREAAIRKDWEKQHPDAKEGTGPFPWRTTLILRRRGVPVHEDILVRFADGSTERAVWDDEARWKRLTWVKPVRVVSAELDPDGRHWLDSNVIGHGRRLEADSSASRRWTGDLASVVEGLLALVASL